MRTINNIYEECLVVKTAKEYIRNIRSRKDKMAQTYLLFSIIILICMSASVIEMGVTWFDAQETCHRKNKKMIVDTSAATEGDIFWTGRYTSLSRWIKILGCYADAEVEKHLLYSFKMQYPSHGLCQEECLLLNSNTFGIKNDTCICLQRPVEGQRKLASMCNIICNKAVDIKFSTACGGMTTYNVFQTDLYDAHQLHNPDLNLCLAIECRTAYKKFRYDSCSEFLLKVCQHADESTANIENWNWTTSMANCIALGSYLFADIDLSNVTSACLKLETNITITGPSWLGVTKQKFISVDRGMNITEEKKSTFVMCEVCRNKICSFNHCSRELNGTVKCVPILQTSSITVRTTQIYSTSFAKETTQVTRTALSTPSVSMVTANSTTMTLISTEKEISKDTNATNSNENQKEKKDLELLFSIFIPVFLLLIIAALLGFFVYKRKQIKHKKDKPPEDRKTTLGEQNTNGENIDTDISKSTNSYFILEPAESCCEIKKKYAEDAESPYNEEKEGVYDHLRDTQSRRKVDDMYQTSPYLQTCDFTNYAFTGVLKSQKSEDTYDHANIQNSYIKSDYDTLQRD